jgi:hypothetical protein
MVMHAEIVLDAYTSFMHVIIPNLVRNGPK